MQEITGNARIDSILGIMAALVPLCSALASLLNHVVRVQTSGGQQASRLLLGAGSLLNLASVNLDKGVQFAKMAMGKTPPHTDAAVMAPDQADSSKPAPPPAP